MPNFSVEAIETFIKNKRINIEIPSNLDCISISEIVDLVMETTIKLKAVDVKQPKWKLAKSKKDLAEDLCRTLSWLGFFDNQGVIMESDEPPPIKFQFDSDSKMSIAVAQDLMCRHGYVLTSKEPYILSNNVNNDIPQQVSWAAFALQYADDEALILYNKGERRITQRKIAPLVAKRFEKEKIYGESGHILNFETIRKRGLKGWRFKSTNNKNGATGARVAREEKK